MRNHGQLTSCYLKPNLYDMDVYNFIQNTYFLCWVTTTMLIYYYKDFLNLLECALIVTMMVNKVLKSWLPSLNNWKTKNIMNQKLSSLNMYNENAFRWSRMPQRVSPMLSWFKYIFSSGGFTSAS